MEAEIIVPASTRELVGVIDAAQSHLVKLKKGVDRKKPLAKVE